MPDRYLYVPSWVGRHFAAKRFSGRLNPWPRIRNTGLCHLFHFVITVPAKFDEIFLCVLLTAVNADLALHDGTLQHLHGACLQGHRPSAFLPSAYRPDTTTWAGSNLLSACNRPLPWQGRGLAEACSFPLQLPARSVPIQPLSATASKSRGRTQPPARRVSVGSRPQRP